MTTVICDLDGVIYRGRTPIPGSSEGLARLNDSGARVLFATNNSTRSPADSATKIKEVTGIAVDPVAVFTSAMAAARILRPEDSPVMVIGEKGIVDAVLDRGLDLTRQPEDAKSVVVGLYRDVGYDDIANAADAVRSGARFIATNTDATFPTASGLKPGSGAIVAAIAAVAGQTPEVCGKPHVPMRALIKNTGVGNDVWVIGDRVDTDIALADGESGWRSILVLTGVTGPGEPTGGADHIVADFAAAVDVVLGTDQQR